MLVRIRLCYPWIIFLGDAWSMTADQISVKKRLPCLPNNCIACRLAQKRKQTGWQTDFRQPALRNLETKARTWNETEYSAHSPLRGELWCRWVLNNCISLLAMLEFCLLSQYLGVWDADESSWRCFLCPFWGGAEWLCAQHGCGPSVVVAPCGLVYQSCCLANGFLLVMLL